MGKLSSIRMNLFALNRTTDPETIAKCIEQVKEIQNIEKEIRAISHDLNNNIFSDSVNFVSIVENLFTAIKSHTAIDFSLKVNETIDWETVENNTKINIYRIIQEALQNIDKYAQATTVSITMEKKENTIVIEIKDDGVGFKIKKEKSGIGIANMKARMEEIKGQFKIESELKKGTKINLSIPN
jgi:signal transduction histidine kinase